MRSIRFYFFMPRVFMTWVFMPWVFMLWLCFYVTHAAAENSQPTQRAAEWAAEWAVGDIVLEDILPAGGNITIKLGKVILQDELTVVTGEIYFADTPDKTADAKISLINNDRIRAAFNNINTEHVYGLLPWTKPFLQAIDDWGLLLEFSLNEGKPEGGMFSVQSQVMDISGNFAVDEDFNLTALDSLKVRVRDVVLQGEAEITQQGDTEFSLSLFMAETSAGYSTDTLMQDWPSALAPAPRAWVADNIFKGEVYDGELHLSGSAEGGVWVVDDFSAALQVRHGEFTYWSRMPRVSAEDVTLHFSQDELLIRSDTAATETMQNIQAQAIIPFSATRQAEATVHIKQHFDDIVALVNAPDVQLLQGLLPEAAEGEEFAGLATFRFPLTSDLQAEEVRFSLQGALSDFYSSQTPLADNLPMRADILRIDGNNDSIEISGDNVVLDSLTTKIHWLLPLNQDTDPQYRIELSVDSLVESPLWESLQLHGLHYLSEDYISGTAIIDVITHGNGQFYITADVTDSTLDIMPLYIKKPAGVRGIFRTDLAILHDGMWQFQDLTYQDSENFVALAMDIKPAEVSPLKALHIARLRTPTSDLSADVTTHTDNDNIVGGTVGYHINIDARRLDLIHFFDFAWDREPPEEEMLDAQLSKRDTDNLLLPDFTLIVSAAELTGELQASGIKNINLAVNYQSHKIRKLDFAGVIDEVLGYINYAADDENSRLNADIPNFGKLLRYAGLSQSITGGKLQIIATSPKPGEPMIGSFTATDFRILQNRLLARLLQLASASAFAALSGKGLYVNTWDSEIAYKDDLLSFTEGRLQGPSIFMTIEGTINRKESQTELHGTLVPFYRFLNLPLIRDIFRSNQKNAVIGFSYRIEGDSKDPSIFVNPLSIITRALP